MKIAAILTYQVDAGGGFNQSLDAILQMKRLSEGRFDFVVYTNVPENLSYLSEIGVNAIIFSITWKDRFLKFCVRNEIARQLQRKIKFIGGFEKLLAKNSVDLVYFLSPESLCFALQKLNYIITVWDLCHRDMPEFPEVREFYEFHTRESFYRNALPPAFLVLTDSNELNERIAFRYGVDRERLLSMPFTPGLFTASQRSVSKAGVLKKYQIEEGYYFYPAQFWSHKNHVRVLEALSQLVKDRINRQVVFAGGDQGVIEQIKNVIFKLGVSERVKILGFVPAEDMRGLYEGCLAVVMPTYFGPTNLPPMEAWAIGKPLIYSKHLSQQVGDAALLVDPDDAFALAGAMKDVIRADISDKLIRNGKKRLIEINEERTEAELKLLNLIHCFALRVVY